MARLLLFQILADSIPHIDAIPHSTGATGVTRPHHSNQQAHANRPWLVVAVTAIVAPVHILGDDIMV